MENDNITAVYEKTPPGMSSPIYQDQEEESAQFPVKTAIVILLLVTVVMLSGMGWILYNRSAKSGSPLKNAVAPTNSEQNVDENIPPDYTDYFTFTVPDGYATLKGYESETYGRSIVALKAPEESGFTDPYIKFNLVPKDPNVSIEKFAYDPDLCDPESELGKDCGGMYTPPYEDKEITVAGKKALWQRYDRPSSGNRLLVFIEKSPTEAVIISSFAHEDTSESAKLDERIIPVFEAILASFKFVE